jgi:hypothetical protein
MNDPIRIDVFDGPLVGRSYQLGEPRHLPKDQLTAVNAVEHEGALHWIDRQGVAHRWLGEPPATSGRPRLTLANAVAFGGILGGFALLQALPILGVAVIVGAALIYATGQLRKALG